VQLVRYVLMGSSGLRVSELALGTMTFGAEGWGVEEDESRRVYEGFREAGGNFVDTANLYSDGRSETYLGAFLADHRDEMVLATKYSFSRSKDVNTHGNSRKNMMASVHASLRRLKTDYIDLYWVHFKDHTTPIDEVMRGLDDLVTQGKVHYVGISDAPAWQVARGNTIAELRGWTSFVGLQVRYSLLDRDVEHELLPMARALDLTVTPWDTLGQGVLTGKYNLSSDASGRATLSRAVPARALGIAAVVVDVAEEIGATPSQVALAWVRDREGVVVPLVGARTRVQLDENLGCLDVVLSAEQRSLLDEASAGRTPFPHNMIGTTVSDEVRTHRPHQH
jgi:aryl-alcohol dehydrogenase-like predicted oxidoreductase